MTKSKIHIIHIVDLAVLALVATLCLVSFFFPKQPENLVSFRGESAYVSNGTRAGLLGPVKSGVKLKRHSQWFVMDFYVPYWGDSCELWVEETEYHKFVLGDQPLTKREEAKLSHDVRVYAVAIHDEDTEHWTKYVAEHPRGENWQYLCGFISLGLFLMYLFALLYIKFFSK